jgi:hypothetical protein
MRKKLFAAWKYFIDSVAGSNLPKSAEINPNKTNITPIPEEIHAIQFNAFISLNLD